NFVFGRGATTGKALAGHPDIGMVSFTGSVQTGRAVMTAAAQNITKVNLELGGKAPAIVVADADLPLAVNAIKASRIINGGKVGNRGAGSYFEPTVLVNCRQDMDIMQKEVFGPVLPVNVVDNLDEAIERANDSIYGLTSSIYTSSIQTALRACNELRFGET